MKTDSPAVRAAWSAFTVGSPSTPPAENSKAVGGPSAADGQGVCTQCGAASATSCNANGCFYLENSSEAGQAVGDGQGVCAYRLHFLWPPLDKHVGDPESIDAGTESDAAQWCELALMRGASVISLERL